jgi:DNA transformation protein
MAHDEFVHHCLELLAPLGAARSRRMFSGHGFYVDDLFIALIFRDRLYLKADSQTQTRFAEAGGEPFIYEGQGKAVTINYWTVPADAMESPWARLAMQSALQARARAARPRKARAPTVRPRAAAAKTPARRSRP